VTREAAYDCEYNKHTSSLEGEAGIGERKGRGREILFVAHALWLARENDVRQMDLVSENGKGPWYILVDPVSFSIMRRSRWRLAAR
jgi:hypothetical protein